MQFLFSSVQKNIWHRHPHLNRHDAPLQNRFRIIREKFGWPSPNAFLVVMPGTLDASGGMTKPSGLISNIRYIIVLCSLLYHGKGQESVNESSLLLSRRRSRSPSVEASYSSRTSPPVSGDRDYSTTTITPSAVTL